MAFQKGVAANPAGRPKGSKNKRDLKLEALTVEAIGEGLTPLEFFLGVLRNECMPLGFRYDCAKAAAPYVHRKKPIEVEVTNPEFKVLDMSQLEGLSDAELAVLEKLMDKAVQAEARRRDPKLDPRVIEHVTSTPMLPGPKKHPTPKKKA